MKFGISLLPFVPLRREQTDRSEMVSQILFGEVFKITETTDKWALINLVYDNYSGWADRNMITIIAENEYNSLVKADSITISERFYNITDIKSGNDILIPAGSQVYNYDTKNHIFTIGTHRFKALSQPHLPDDKDKRQRITDSLQAFVGTPYLWGGRSTYGTDCSGFVQTVMKINGIKIPRDASEQVKLGRNINFLGDCLPGYHAFFDNNEGEIIHTGMLINSKTVIHASGKVRKDPIDHQGIFNRERGIYTHRLRVIKDVVS